MGRVPSAAGADARRRDAGDTGISPRSANAVDAPVPPEPFGRIGIAGNLCVARRQRCPRIASSSRLDLARNTYARDLLYFHHGLLEPACGFDKPKSEIESEKIDDITKIRSGDDIAHEMVISCNQGERECSPERNPPITQP